MPTAILHDLVECELCSDEVAETTTLGCWELCSHCAADAELCVECGEPSTETVITSAGDAVCQSCARDHYTECDDCDRFEGDLWITDVEDKSVCQDCATSYNSCELCHDLTSNPELCDECEESRDSEESDIIHDYCYKPCPVFFGKGPAFFGVELELNTPVGDREECAETAASQLDDIAYLKEDGSLDHGFEIVTHPMSYEWAMQSFPWSLLHKLDASGCDADDAGLHVHISRAAFDSPAHVYKWMKFLYRNAGDVIQVARRESEQWAAFDPAARQKVKQYAKGEQRSKRYSAINTQPVNTFELRVFASSLDPADVQAAIGLSAASVEYTRTLTTRDIVEGGWEWGSFVAWLRKRPEYAPLLRVVGVPTCAC